MFSPQMFACPPLSYYVLSGNKPPVDLLLFKVIIRFTPICNNVTVFRCLNAADKHTRTHEQCGDAKVWVLERFPFHKAYHNAAYTAVMSVNLSIRLIC